jgi:hypothetical protein
MLREIVVLNSEHYDLHIPKEYLNRPIEILVFPVDHKNINYNNWSEEEIENIGKIGLISKSFEQDDEDYSKW